jgi:hypothetical protein
MKANSLRDDRMISEIRASASHDGMHWLPATGPAWTPAPGGGAGPGRQHRCLVPIAAALFLCHSVTHGLYTDCE